jgi:hypothetical protein
MSIDAAALAAALITVVIYPEAPHGTVVDDFHGTQVADASRSLEESGCSRG